MDLLPNSADELRARISRLHFSPVALRITEVANNERAPVQSLAAAITSDPLLAARLLAVANLATGLSQRLATVPQAVVALGLDNLKALALGLAAFGLPAMPSRSESLPFDDAPITLCHLWEHALGCATLAGRMGAIAGVAPHQAFVAGFLHDIGRVLLQRHAHKSFVAALTLAADKSIPLAEAETLGLGISHCELGEIWTRKANLPMVFQCTVREHHQPLPPASAQVEGRRLMAVVQLADSLCEAQAIGKGGDSTKVATDLWRALELREADWTEHPLSIKQEIESLREMFGFPGQDRADTPPLRRASPRPAIVAAPERQKNTVNGSRGQVIPFPERLDKPRRNDDPASAKKLTMLVVEDHGSLCDMLSLFFMRHGYHIRSANNGEDALEILAKEEIHLVLLDLMLPRLDGFGVLKQLRRERPDGTPYVIVVSAGASEKDRDKVLELGANEYMPKPFHLTRLLDRVRLVEKTLL